MVGHVASDTREWRESDPGLAASPSLRIYLVPRYCTVVHIYTFKGVKEHNHSGNHSR